MTHAKKATEFNKDQAKVNWHDKALWYVREKRDTAAHGVKNWEYLRDLASKIKANVLSDLDNYLIQFEANAIKNGIQVHWAYDAEEHNRIAYDILLKHQVKKIVKSKSMLTEECHLNPYLEKKGIEVVDTDLGERIVQLAKETPSHIVLPAIHKTKEDVDILFQKYLGTEPCDGNPEYLTKMARNHLRQKFLSSDAAITGVNFAIADTGGFVVCTNEGNADMGVNLAKVHIASMGIEKIIPKQVHLGVFLRLLARSATGQPITTYSSHFNSPAKGKEIHIIIVDNGRTEQLSREDFRSSLHCIRCGACMNTCPIYRRSGGHSYDATIPGPIGSILSPGKDLTKHSSLPFASTLCGSCSNVCPVKINIHEQLYQWRQLITKEVKQPLVKKSVLKTAGLVLSNSKLYNLAGKSVRFLLKYAPRFVVYNQLNIWGKSRELPKVEQKNFDQWYKLNRNKNE